MPNFKKFNKFWHHKTVHYYTTINMKYYYYLISNKYRIMLKLGKDEFTYGSETAKIKTWFMVVGGISFYFMYPL